MKRSLRWMSSLRWVLLVVPVVMAVVLMPASVVANLPDDGVPPIRLNISTMFPARDTPPSDTSLAAAPQRWVGERGQYIVQFEGPVLASWRAALVAAGVTVRDYIPDYAYTVEMTAATAADVSRWAEVIWVGAYAPAYCVAPHLTERAEGLVRVEAKTEEARIALRDLVMRHSGQVVGGEGTTLVARVDAETLAALSRAAETVWIDRFAVPQLHNDVAAGEIGADMAWLRGFDGLGQTVNVADTGLDTGEDYPQVIGDIHRDIDGRVVHIHSWPISELYHGLLLNPLDNDGASDEWSGHGTHVAGSVAGNGSQSGEKYRGMAYHANLTFQALEQYGEFNAAGRAEGYGDGYYLLGIPSDLASLYGEAYRWGSRIHTNSWGLDASSAGQYDILAQQTDRYVWEHRDMAIVFSVGNEARDDDEDGHSDSGSIVAPATAKNIIAVGATENRRPSLVAQWPYQTYEQFFGIAFSAAPIANDGMADAGIDGMFAGSGRGPIGDGRLAPHVVAPGAWIASLRSSVALEPGWAAYPNIYPHYCYLGGTSMSAPIVAGSVALVRQAYQSQGHTPSAALLKATLIQTATDIPGQYAGAFNEAGAIPNHDEGWGAIDVEGAVLPGRHFVDETRALDTGGVANEVYVAGAASAAHPAKFTLVWTDYPAAPEAGVDLVNDLDLVVTAPDGQVYRGNVFVGGVSQTGGTADRVNNVECVYLPVGAAGTYAVAVIGHNVPQGPQNYALLVDVSPLLPQQRRLALPLVVKSFHVAPTPTATQTAPLTIVAPTGTITATATVTPDVTPTPTWAPAEFRDDFETPDGAWWVESSTEYIIEYLAGEYRIAVYPDRYRVGSLPAVHGADDMLLEVDGRVANDTNQAYGLLFNHRNLAGGGTAYHTFVVAPSGYYGIATVSNGEEAPVIEWTASDAIRLDRATNRLSMRRVGQQVVLGVNGQDLTTLSGPEYAMGIDFGLVVLRYEAPYADVRFDNLRMVPGTMGWARDRLAPRVEVSAVAKDAVRSLMGAAPRRPRAARTPAAPASPGIGRSKR